MCRAQLVNTNANIDASKDIQLPKSTDGQKMHAWGDTMAAVEGVRRGSESFLGSPKKENIIINASGQRNHVIFYNGIRCF